MSKRAGNKKRRGTRFVMLEDWFLRTEAWRSLSPVARAAYVEFADRFNGSNNGHLAMAVRSLADAINVGKSTAERALAELLERGFIEVTQASSFNVKTRLATEYRLTAHFCNRTNQPASKRFREWTAQKKTQSRLRDRTVPSQGPSPENPTKIPAHSPVSGTETRRFGT
ncbi:hypothetical protein [Roseitalea porphyridii]|uniref:Helix-turn-helix domain-containing protein n=1 Tax=Roseitalea porphyridii TaxID=1852022 RepID=A0A4P6V282_9HYPH|nr:hypothetical protein [Roseitalea porphyridii]QBK30779.1 hypothetical protein E0E05_09345 [Roseitalea porphyridii]